jgi:hypothetical protein
MSADSIAICYCQGSGIDLTAAQVAEIPAALG